MLPSPPSTGRLLLGALVLVLAIACDDSPAPSPVAPQPVTPSTPAPTPAPAPPGPMTYSGIVREPGAGPLRDVAIAGIGASDVKTDFNGAFSFDAIVKNIITFNKTGYRYTYVLPNSVSDRTHMEVRMQLTYEVAETRSVTAKIFPDDLEYSSDLANMWWERPFFCGPCRFITVGPSPTTSRVFRLRWLSAVPLDLLGEDYYAEGPLIASGAAGASEVLLTLPATQWYQTLLVGIGKRNGQPQPVTSPIDFTLNIEPVASAPTP